MHFLKLHKGTIVPLLSRGIKKIPGKKKAILTFCSDGFRSVSDSLAQIHTHTQSTEAYPSVPKTPF